MFLIGNDLFLTLETLLSKTLLCQDISSSLSSYRCSLHLILLNEEVSQSVMYRYLLHFTIRYFIRVVLRYTFIKWCSYFYPTVYLYWIPFISWLHLLLLLLRHTILTTHTNGRTDINQMGVGGCRHGEWAERVGTVRTSPRQPRTKTSEDVFVRNKMYE